MNDFISWDAFSLQMKFKKKTYDSTGFSIDTAKMNKLFKNSNFESRDAFLRS